MKRCQIWQSDEVKCQEKCVLQTVLIYIDHSPVACKQTFIFVVYVLMTDITTDCARGESVCCVFANSIGYIMCQLIAHWFKI